MSPVWNQPPAKAAGRGLGVPPVALEDLRAPQHDLAALAGRERLSLLVPDVELDVEARPAHAAQFGHDAVAIQEGVARHRLGEPVGVGEPGRREGPLDPLDQGDRHLLAAVDDQPHGGEVCSVDVGERHDRVDHRRGQPHGGHPGPLELGHDRGGVERAVDDDRGPHRDQRRRSEVEGPDVVERPAGEADVGAGEAELDDVGQVLPGQVGVRQHHALGPPRRPRRVHEPVDVVAGQPGGRRGRHACAARPTACQPSGARSATQARTSAAERPAVACVRQRQEGLVAHERPRLGVVEQVVDLGRGQAPVDRHDDGTEVVGGEDRLEELRWSCRRGGRPRRRARCRARAARRPARWPAPASRRRRRARIRRPPTPVPAGARVVGEDAVPVDVAPDRLCVRHHRGVTTRGPRACRPPTRRGGCGPPAGSSDITRSVNHQVPSIRSNRST